MTLLGRVGRRQAQGLFGELGSDRRGATRHGDPSGLLQHLGRSCVRGFLRQREMACAKERIVDDRCNTCMNVPPLFAQIVVEDGREQRMGEANRPVLPLDHTRCERRSERLECHIRPLEDRFIDRSHRRGEGEGFASRRREPRDPRPDQLLERLGNREATRWIDIHVEHAGQLQRKKGITPGPVVDA